MLFEDRLLLRDPKSLLALFASGAVLVIRNVGLAHGQDIARLALATWIGEQSYVADPLHVIQGRDIALIISVLGVNVVRRGKDGCWRYAIVCQSVKDTD